MDRSNKIKTAKNIINIMEDLNKIDINLEKKYKINCYEIELYTKILNESTESFKNISKNLSY